MDTKVRVRGIYATALTTLLWKRGFFIVDPSPVIMERLHLEPHQGPADVDIFDRSDRQGVRIEGNREAARLAVAALREALPEAIVRALSTPMDPGEIRERRLTWAEFVSLSRTTFDMEFPYGVKQALDRTRAESTPTIPGHHFLKAVDPFSVEDIEKEPTLSRESLSEAADLLRRELIYNHYPPGRALVIQHVKLNGQEIELRGKLKEFQPGKALVVERRFKAGGYYDGLALPKEEGDWGLIELAEESWVSRHSYFSAGGALKGELYNINTPPEIYPDGVRYIDLEVDVVRWPSGETQIIDLEELEEAVRAGFITRELANRALNEARQVEARLKGRVD